MRRFLRNPGEEGGEGSRSSSPVFSPLEENGVSLGGKDTSTRLNRVSMNRSCCYPIHVPRVFLPSTRKNCFELQPQPNLFSRLPKLGPIPSIKDDLPHVLQLKDEFCSRGADIGPRADHGAFIDKSVFQSNFQEGHDHIESYPSISRSSSSETHQRPCEQYLPRPPTSECRPPSCVRLRYARKFRAGTAVPQIETCLPSSERSPEPGLLVARGIKGEASSALIADSKCAFGDCISFSEAKCYKRACAFEIPFHDTEEKKRSVSTQSYLSRDSRSSNTSTVRFDQQLLNGDLCVQDNHLRTSNHPSLPKSVAFEIAFTPVPPKTPKPESTRYRKSISRAKDVKKTAEDGRCKKTRIVQTQHGASGVLIPLNHSKRPETIRARANVIDVPVRKKQLDRVTIDALKRIREFRHKPVKNVVRRRVKGAFNAEVCRNSSKQLSIEAPSSSGKEIRTSRNNNPDFAPFRDRSRIPVLISGYYGNLPHGRSRVIKETSRCLDTETTACINQSRIPRLGEPVSSSSHVSSKRIMPLAATPVQQSSLAIDKIEAEGRGNTADVSSQSSTSAVPRAGNLALEEQLHLAIPHRQPSQELYLAIPHMQPSQEVRRFHIERSDERPPASTCLLYPFQNLVKSTLTAADEARKISMGLFGISTEQSQGRFSSPMKFGKSILYHDQSDHCECPTIRKLTPFVKNRGGWRNSSTNGNSNI